MRRTIRSRLPADLAHELGGYLDLEPLGHPAARVHRRRCRAGRSAPCRSWSTSTTACCARCATSVRMETGTRTPEETLEAGDGSCRDSAWLLVQALRHLGLPARFVSGYLIQLKPDVATQDGAEAGQRGPARLGRGVHSRRRLDRARSDLRAARRRRAHPAGRDAALSLRRADHRHGRAGGDDSSSFEMSVARVAETPRVTRPFSDEAWAALDALGEAVDARPRRRRRAAHDGRRADLRVGRRLSVARMDDRGARARTSACAPTN